MLCSAIIVLPIGVALRGVVCVCVLPSCVVLCLCAGGRVGACMQLVGGWVCRSPERMMFECASTKQEVAADPTRWVLWLLPDLDIQQPEFGHAVVQISEHLRSRSPHPTFIQNGSPLLKSTFLEHKQSHSLHSHLLAPVSGDQT